MVYSCRAKIFGMICAYIIFWSRRVKAKRTRRRLGGEKTVHVQTGAIDIVSIFLDYFWRLLEVV
jgi:hypothetical protein